MTELPGNRETAYRVFAAEFDDATVDYQEGEEERAPNYVVTPTGARANRLFVVGVLTEIEDVNDDVLRARIVDPTGAFVVYAGQYQPDEMAALERLDPPAFVAVTGKARTFSPDDSDRVFTSIRPESINTVDAETRDRWVVRTAEHTVKRVGTLAAAAGHDATGEDLREMLESQGVPAPTASGVSLALEHYGTTPAYLAGVRELAVDAAEVVAGDRDEVDAYDRSPSDAGDGTHSYADLAGELVDDGAAASARPDQPAAAETATPTGEDAAPEPTDETDAPSAGEAVDADATTDTAAEDADTDADTAADTETATETETATDTEPADDGDTTGEVAADATTDTTADAEPSGDAGTGDEESGTATAAVDDASDDDGDHEDAAADAGDDDAVDEAADAGDEDATGGDDAAGGDDVTGDEAGDESVGDFEPGSLGGDSEATSDQMYEFDEEERQEIEDEYGTEFASGNDVPEPEESDLDAPDPEAVAGDADADSDAVETTEADASDDADEVDDGAAADDSEPTADDEPVEDVDVDAFVMDAMRDMDDGDGVDRGALLDRVADETGADADAVEDAIQDALMGGQCYEPDDDVLKPI
ncbi:hypothetical protein [Halorubellus sp. PRR65]|uniref:hypothetical protein n=1 Tax=Halorubellus sp. PRR65 TaxID=3098148 RepID=UPI002B25B8D5|nr:hypothetical protein [Halorubellus sp. PRR65]